MAHQIDNLENFQIVILNYEECKVIYDNFLKHKNKKNYNSLKNIILEKWDLLRVNLPLILKDNEHKIIINTQLSDVLNTWNNYENNLLNYIPQQPQQLQSS